MLFCLLFFLQLQDFVVCDPTVLVKRYLDGGLLDQLEPVSALAALGVTLVQPHPLNVGLIFLTDASDEARLERRRDHVRVLLGARAALEHTHVEGIGVAGSVGQQLALLQTGRMLDRVVHHFAEAHRRVGDVALGRVQHQSSAEGRHRRFLEIAHTRRRVSERKKFDFAARLREKWHFVRVAFCKNLQIGRAHV